jgi:membrane protease YdiL (CAAX protease family)
LEVRGSQAGALLGYFGPALAALLVAALTAGRQGLRALLARLFRWRVPLRWYLVAILLPAGSALLVVGLLAIVEGQLSNLDTSGLQPILPEILAVLVFGSLYGLVVAAGEELGWRVFALPRLLARHNALVASIVLGIVWGLWHVPVGFWFDSQAPALGDALLYGLGFDFAAVIYTWLFLHSRGSVLIASLFHAVYDISLLVIGQIAQATPGLDFAPRLHLVVLGLVAALLVVAYGPQLCRAAEPTL